MNVFIIHSSLSNPRVIKDLESASLKNGLEPIFINSERFKQEEFFKLNKSGMYYCIGIDYNSLIIDSLFTSKGFTSLYKDEYVKYGWSNAVMSPIIHERNNIPIPKTIYTPTKDRDILEEYIKFLGGFPLILKVMGNSGGIGVLKVESRDSLYSLVDFLAYKNPNYIMREFIDFSIYGRLIVLGDKTIASKQNLKQLGDFRTNEGSPVNKEFNEEIKECAVKAVNVLGIEFGGVDVLVKTDGSFVIAEVNYPCSYISTQETSGVEISDMMIKFLKAKFQAKN